MLTAVHLGDQDAEVEAAKHLVATLAEGLFLQPEDVYLTWTVPAVAVLGTASARPWPVMLIHGRTRPTASAAMQAIARLAAELWDVPQANVWVQWIAPDPSPETL